MARKPPSNATSRQGYRRWLWRKVVADVNAADKKRCSVRWSGEIRQTRPERRKLSKAYFKKLHSERAT